MEPVKTIEEPKVTQDPGQVKDPQETPAEDLLSRVSKFQAKEAPVDNPKLDAISGNFDIKEIDAIADPVAKEQALNAYKSFQRGFGEKFQELAQLKKEMEALKAQPHTALSKEWTPERVQELANDPKFIEAAKQVAGNQTEDEYSSMSEAEKAQMKALQDKVRQLEQASSRALQTQQQALRQSQHQSLQDKYANYDPKEIDTITFDMLNGKIQATPEHIYKAFKHDDNVRNAYELGRKDERDGVSTKIASASAEGIQTTYSSPELKPEEGESSKAFFNRIIENNIKKFAGKR